MIKVLIVDDQELFRESLSLILAAQSEIDVVGSAANGQEAIKLTRDLMPDVVLMDIRMPEINGIECTKIIKEQYPEIKVIVLTTFDDDEYIYEALKNGADGFLLKGTTKSDLVRAIETVYNHGVSVDPDIARKVFAMFGKMIKTMPSQPGSLDESNIEDLTRNEIRIIQLIGRGLSNKEITSELNFSEGTVRNYISTILKKLDLRDRTQIAIFALQSSLMLKDTVDNDK